MCRGDDWAWLRNPKSWGPYRFTHGLLLFFLPAASTTRCCAPVFHWNDPWKSSHIIRADPRHYTQKIPGKLASLVRRQYSSMGVYSADCPHLKSVNTSLRVLWESRRIFKTLFLFLVCYTSLDPHSVFHPLFAVPCWNLRYPLSDLWVQFAPSKNISTCGQKLKMDFSGSADVTQGTLFW